MEAQEIKVLDHGVVRLIDSMGDDLSIVRAARVSYDAAWRAGENEGSDHRLIHYLYKHKHMTPFEAVTFTFEVKAPIFVFRQWHRHRTWSYNELSARYRPLPEEFYVPDPMLVGVQAAKNKQARDLADTIPPELVEARKAQCALLESASKSAFETYRELLDAGWPRELARSILPVNTYSHMFASVDLRNLFAFLDLRDDAHAQYEIRVYAQALAELARKVCPVAFSAWDAVRNQKPASEGA